MTRRLRRSSLSAKRMIDHMDKKGYLRLTTHAQTIKLMGNAIPEEIAQIAKSHGLDVKKANIATSKTGLLKKIARNKVVRYIMQGVVNKLYALLNLK